MNAGLLSIVTGLEPGSTGLCIALKPLGLLVVASFQVSEERITRYWATYMQRAHALDALLGLKQYEVRPTPLRGHYLTSTNAVRILSLSASLPSGLSPCSCKPAENEDKRRAEAARRQVEEKCPEPPASAPSPAAPRSSPAPCTAARPTHVSRTGVEVRRPHVGSAVTTAAVLRQ